MEFESTSEAESELESAQELRKVRRELRPWMDPSWSQAWLQAWPRAKTVAMEVEVEVRHLAAQPWAEVWTRAEAIAWAEPKARAEEKVRSAKKLWVWRGEAPNKLWAEAEADGLSMARAMEWEEGLVFSAAARGGAEARVEASALAEALALAGAGAWARGEARARGEALPLALEDSSTIRDILSDLNRYGVARDLWPGSPESRDEYSCLIHFISPITRLPLELLHQILLIIINDDETSGPPSVLMLVCKHWRAIVTTIWASLNLGTTTPIDAVTSKLEQSQWLLDIVVDTDSDRGDFTPAPLDSPFDAIFAAIEASSRWRSLVVKSFPAPADLPEDLVNRRLQRCSNATMSRFTTLKIESACQASPLLNGLLHILGTTASSELTAVEINSPNVISFLAPTYPSIFRSVKVLSLDTQGTPNPVDLLPHLHQLESFTASHISFPTYHNDVDLPFIHSLRHLRLRAASIQWMSGRTFHILEDCTLIFPLHRHVLHTFNTTLPNCKRLTFQGSPLNILYNISANKQTHLSVTCPGDFNGRGNQQLVQLSCQLLGQRQHALKILHISINATNQAWVNALAFMSHLEELVIHNARPCSLGAKVFQSLVVQRGHTSNSGATSTPIESCAPLCSSLRRFGLKYDRWLRPGERFDLIPVFKSIIQSRKQSDYSLESFDLWTKSDQKDPLELIKGLEMSAEGFDHLAKESASLLDLPRIWPIQPGMTSMSPDSVDSGSSQGDWSPVSPGLGADLTYWVTRWVHPGNPLSLPPVPPVHLP